MYRLSDHIARRRCLYRAPVVGTPHVVLVDLPTTARGGGLALGRFYALLPEAEHEIAEVEAFLEAPREAPATLDLLDRRPSAVRSPDLLIVRYEPPAQGWPWLSVCCWPADAADTELRSDIEMTRVCYTFEAFLDERQLERHIVELLSSLSRHSKLSMRLLAADRLPPPGTA